MNIIFYHPFFNQEEWIGLIKSRLPDANVRVWQSGDNAVADYALTWLPPHDMLAGRGALKGIFALGAGVDGILKRLETEPDLLPKNVPFYRIEDAGMALQMQEYCLAYVMRYFRRFDEYQLQQNVSHWQHLKPHTYDNFTIGVMGVGALGAQVAKSLAALGFKVKGWSRSQKEIAGVSCFDQTQLDGFLSGTQLIINLLPSTPLTNGILNKNLFNQLNHGAYLINLARGIHINEADMLDALNSGQLAAVTLDVFQAEPLVKEHPFWTHPRVTITPHIGAFSDAAIAADQLSDAILALEAGKPVTRGYVDIDKGY